MPANEYAFKYPRVNVDYLRHTIIPNCANECAKKRAIYGWTGDQYRDCLKDCIKNKVKEWAARQYGA